MFVEHKLLDVHQHIDKIHSYQDEFYLYLLLIQLKHPKKNHHQYYHLLLQKYSNLNIEKKNSK